MKIKLCCIIIAVAFCSCSSIGKFNYNDELKKANAHYENKEYKDAIKSYSNMIDSGNLNSKELEKIFYNRGVANLSKRDLQKAINDFSYCIKVNPKGVYAYSKRAYAYFLLKDFNKSLKDDSTTISLEPRNAIRYWFRGMTYIEKGLFAKSLEDLNTAIKLNPKEALFYSSKGTVFRRMELYPKAILEYEKALSLAESQRKDKAFRYYLAICNYYLNNFEKSKENLIEILKSKEKDEYNDYAMLWLELLDIRNNKKIANDHTFSKSNLKAIGKMLAGKKTVSECVNAALSEDSKIERGQLCEAYFFIAQYYLLVKKDKGKAEKFFWKCIDTGKRDFIEYDCSKAELKRLYKQQK